MNLQIQKFDKRKFEWCFAIFVFLLFLMSFYLQIMFKKFNLISLSFFNIVKGRQTIVSDFFLKVVDHILVTHNVVWPIISYFMFIVAIKHLSFCTSLFYYLVLSLSEENPKKLNEISIQKQQFSLIQCNFWLQKFLDIKSLIQRIFGFLVLMYLLQLFILLTLFVIIIWELKRYRPIRGFCGFYYAFTFCTPLILSVVFVDTCEQRFRTTCYQMHLYVCRQLAAEHRTERSYIRYLLAAFELLKYGKKSDFISAWEIINVNRQLPFQFLNLNISFIVTLYNLVNASINNF